MCVATPEEFLTAAEAAFVSGVTAADVDVALDERILPEGLLSHDHGRRILAGACPLIAFHYGSASFLSFGERLRLVPIAAAELMMRLPATWPELQHQVWSVRNGSTTIDLKPFLVAAAERHAELIGARLAVTTSTEVLGGVPVISGTRIPVHDIAASVAAGLGNERILESFPSLDARKIRLATVYTAANPPFGDRTLSTLLPKGSTIIAGRRIPRVKA